MYQARSANISTVVLCAAIAAGAASRADGGDWPTYRHDAGRCAYTAEELKTPLHLQWAHVPRSAPIPAWPEPVTEVHLMPFDYAFQVAVAGGGVYFGSSADHKVYALDLATGRERWSFFTDAPVRFAPVVHGRKVYVASDDGWAYCLSAGAGKLLWRFRGGPADERLLGNENMISRWPLRSGLAVDGGVVYFTAGMWPSEGVYVYAVKAGDGSVVWKAGGDGFAPQGYLAASEKMLVAPTGRSDAWLIERVTGKIRKGKGTSQAIVKGGLVFSGPFPHKANENLPIRGGVPFAARRRKIVAWDAASGKGRGNFAGRDCTAVSDDTVYLAGSGKIAAHALGNMKVKWEIDYGCVFSLAIAGKRLVVGGDKTVALLETSNGRTVWSASVDGEVRGLAVADGRLLVSTHTGRIICFGPARPRAGAKPAPGPTPSTARNPAAAALAGRILKDTRVTAGFCLLAGAGDGRLALELARQSDLRIYCAEPDEKKVLAARRLLDAPGLYGVRVTVHHIASKTLPYPDYFADLIVVDEKSCGGAARHWPAAELRRVLRPCGGTVWAASSVVSKGPRLWGLGGDDLRRTHLRAGVTKAVRGALPGAGEWTHLYADAGKSGSSGDRLVRWPLRLLWFGKPGPGWMMQRHFRGTAPVSTRGRMFLLGQHSVIAVDAYNGRELWSRRMPSIARRVVDIRGGNLAADGDSIYVATSDLCLRLDAETGRHRRVYRLPVARPRFVLSSPQTIPLGEVGKVVIRNTSEALELKLTTIDSTVTNADRKDNPARGDSWELFFDFRAEAGRTGLYGPGAFGAIVVPATTEHPAASWHGGVWSKAPEAQVTGALGKGGSRTTVRISWAEIRKLAGGKPADFNFGVILNSSDDGESLVGRTRRFANDASYRLANCRARMIVDPARAARTSGAQAKLLKGEHTERLAWGALIVSGDVVLGTTVAPTDSPRILGLGRDFSSEGHDYTGPPVKKVLGNVGVQGRARHVFALDRNDGQPRWVYTAAEGIPHNAIAVAGGRVYLIDRTGDENLAELKRRGRQVAAKASLAALDLATGKCIWRLDEGLEDCRQLRAAHGVLLAAGMKGMTAYSAEDGTKLWSVATKQVMHHCSAFLRAPVITRRWVYDEPRAYDLRTGKPRMGGSSGETGEAWKWSAGGGCGTVSASEHMLFFRAGAPVLFDAAGGTGGHKFVGIRPGCYINIITAGGLVLMPEASSGCGCLYNFQTTVALIPARKRPGAPEDSK